MSVQNLEQKRAAHAFAAIKSDPKKFQTEKDADVTKKVTTMVMDSGMLPAMAYALENKDKVYERVFESYINYRKSANKKLSDYFEVLSQADGRSLRMITADFLAYMKYLRRFANQL